MAHRARLAAVLLLIFLAAFCGTALAQDLPEGLSPFVYGIVLETDPGAEQSVNVTLQWTDEYGVVWEAKVRTVTEEDLAKGDSVLSPDSPIKQGESIQFHSEGITIELTAKPPSEAISRRNTSGSSSSSSTSTTPAGTLGSGTTSGSTGTVPTGPRESHTFGDDVPPEGGEGTTGEATGNVTEGTGTETGEGGETPGEGEEEPGTSRSILAPIKDNIGIIALVIFGVGLLGGAGIAVLELRSRKGAPQVDPGSLKITRLMKKDVQVILKDEPVEKAIHLLVTEELTALPVVSGREVVGLLTLHDIVAHAEDPELRNLKVKEIMSEAKGVSAESTLMEAIEIFLASNLDEMPVLQKKSLVGMTTLRHLLEQLDLFFATIEFKSGTPLLNDILKVHSHVKPIKKMKEVLNMLEENQGPIEVHEVGAVLGLITAREVVHELYHEQGVLPKLPAERVMSKHQFILDARRDIIGANSLMLDHTSYWTRIMKQDKIIGIITNRELFEALVDLLKKYRGGKR